MKIYIAGPYSADSSEGLQNNVNLAMSAALKVAIKGHAPYVPHLKHYIDQYAKRHGVGIPHRWWIAYDNIYLRDCDGLLYLASSPGADIEADWAVKHGKLVYLDVHDIPNNFGANLDGLGTGDWEVCAPSRADEETLAILDAIHGTD